MRGKNQSKKHDGQSKKIKIRQNWRLYNWRLHRVWKIKIRYIAMAVLFNAMLIPQLPVQAESCPAVRIVFARGSGSERWTDRDYQTFQQEIESKLKTVTSDYEFIDLDYPAVGIGLDKLDITVGALLGSGDAYEFGKSVDAGVENLKRMVNSAACPNTKYVLGGYSQGAMVVSKALRWLEADRLIYAATFGDPKLYLPEGGGIMPPACRGENLSDYRMYVPDCQAYKGMLGAYIPYEPDALAGKVGTWCNGRDVFCSSHINFSDHTGYVDKGLYGDASKVIFDKITKALKVENHLSSPHDTAILIDSTGSMAGMIEQYKSEAMRLATETLNSGGRVALFDYRDLRDPYDLTQHCGFEDCTLEKFQDELMAIEVDGGGDEAESLLSASFHAMQALNWKQGSTKSLVILTDANFLMPDWDGVTVEDVKNLSKQIDPVNFYIITTNEHAEDYADLAAGTGGKVVTNFDELSLLTDYIMERYDSLPRVEENAAPTEVPTIEVKNVDYSGDTAMIEFVSTSERVLVALNDKVLGLVEGNKVTLTGLDGTRENIATLVPLGEELRGESVQVELFVGKMGVPAGGGYGGIVLNIPDVAALKAPKTGRR